MKINPNFKKIAIKSAEEAGKILEKHFKKAVKFSYKKDWSVVSDVDLKAEKTIIKLIEKNFPSHNILAEEKGGKLKNGYSWIIDPLDGTTNYLSSFSFFSVAIALFYNKELILGTVFNPMTKELYFAEKGKGAYLNGKRIKVGKKQIPSIVVLGKGRAKKDFIKLHKILGRIIGKYRAFRLWGCTSLDLCYIASGRIDGYINPGSKIWDFAAGVLIVKEAGGKVTDFSGKEWDFKTRNLVASNKKINKLLLGLVK